MNFRLLTIFQIVDGMIIFHRMDVVDGEVADKSFIQKMIGNVDEIVAFATADLPDETQEIVYVQRCKVKEHDLIVDSIDAPIMLRNVPLATKTAEALGTDIPILSIVLGSDDIPSVVDLVVTALESL